MVVVDGRGKVLGRLASRVAKMLLEGKEVHVINAEDIIIVGNPRQVVERYKVRRSLQNKHDPEKSPKWPKVPWMLVRRIIRGMLPRKKLRGRMAFKRLRVYNGNPQGLAVDTEIEEAIKPLPPKHITVGDLCRQLGWKG